MAALNVQPPALPHAPAAYNPPYQDQLNNIHRLFYNRLTNTLGQLADNAPSTVATLPSAVTSGAGARAFVSDAATPVFGSAVVGGGAVVVPVYSNGAVWVVG